MTRDRLFIYDVTLRDGAQTQGVDFSVEDKHQIALTLDALGGGEPFVVPQLSIGLGDPRGGAEALADVRAALTGVGQGADELGIEQLIAKGQGHFIAP